MSNWFMDAHQQHTTAALANGNSKCNYVKSSEHKQNRLNNSMTCATCYSSQPSAKTMMPLTNDAYGDIHQFANVLNLQLRKPKHWRWELSTSRSCSNIALPRILLHDHKGQLLVDANNQEEQCYSQVYPLPQQKKQRADAADILSQNRKRDNKTVNVIPAQSIHKDLHRQFSGLQIKEVTSSPESSHNCSRLTMSTTDHTSESSPIDFCTNELPDHNFRQRSSSLKGVRFKDNDNGKNDSFNGSAKSTPNYFNLANLPTPPSTIITTGTPTNSSSSGAREKRRHRRAHSAGLSTATSESILERFSYNKGRFSSPEEVYHAPRYFLRTSKAGTLVVQDDSFSRYRRRRRTRRRNSYTENIQSSTGSGSKSSKKMVASKGAFKNADRQWGSEEAVEQPIENAARA